MEDLEEAKHTVLSEKMFVFFKCIVTFAVYSNRILIDLTLTFYLLLSK